MSPQSNGILKPAIRRSVSGEHSSSNYTSPSKRHNVISVQLSPIPSSPNATDGSAAPSIASKLSSSSKKDDTIGRLSVPKENDSPTCRSENGTQPTRSTESPTRSKAKQPYTSHRPPPPQSLDAALEKLSTSPSRITIQTSSQDDNFSNASTSHGYGSSDEMPPSPSKRSLKDIPPSPSRPIPETPKYQATVGGKTISAPIMNHGTWKLYSVERSF